MAMKINNVYNKEKWNSAGRGTDYYAILSDEKYRDGKLFWNDIGLRPDVLNALAAETVFLDVGCGFGRIARQINTKIKEYWGMDFSEEMIVRAKEFHKDYSNVFFKVNNGWDLTVFEDNKFDVIYSCLVFQHITKETMLNYIKEFARILKPGGKVFCLNIPKSEKYTNGLDECDLDFGKDLFEKFTLIKETSPHYYDVYATLKEKPL